MSLLVYIDGEFVSREHAAVSVFDRSFLYGDGLFETVRAYRGVPFLLKEHLDRMAGSAAELDMAMPDKARVREAVAELIRRNGLADAYVRVTLSRGLHGGALWPEERLGPRLVIEARAVHPYPAELYARGALVVTSAIRHDSASAVRRHKTTSYITNVLAKREAREQGSDEAILLDHDGDVAEGATSNVFCVRGGAVLTPPLEMNILPGVTRAAVIGLAQDAGLSVREERFGLAELQSADEVFLTNSLMEVMPVRSVDGRELSNTPGVTTRALMAAYHRLTASCQA